MSLRRTLTWLAIAPLGVGLTTGLTITTTLLTQQPIGLSSEPLSAGDALAPRLATATDRGIRTHATRTPAPHGGRAASIAVASTQPARVTPLANLPTPAPATTTKAPTSAKQPTPTSAHATPRTPPPAATQNRTRIEDLGHQRSDGSGHDTTRIDNSGPGTRDD